VSDLREAVDFFNGRETKSVEHMDFSSMYNKFLEKEELQEDFCEINGQETVKRAAEVAVSGMHHLLLIGSPGSGKSMIAKRIAGILPRPDMEECMEITKIHSIAGKLEGKIIKMTRPFRAPHHTLTDKALIGGGGNPKPGEITLAHKGVLFLDELAEFRREAIDSLRQPLEDGYVSISRLGGNYVFPADIMLVAATNPCKCGYYPDRNKCNCSEVQVKNYIGKISGPILDRSDVCITTPSVGVESLGKKCGESSKEIRKRVENARKCQYERYKEEKYRFNSQLPSGHIDKYCYLGEKEKKMMDMAYNTYGLSVRAYYKIIRVARTIADLDGEEYIQEKHIAEAIGYRTDIL
jgi:magnesium chelatase family protein